MHISNASYNIFFLLGFIFLCTQIILGSQLPRLALNTHGDYMSSISQLGICLPFITITNSLLTFFFLMEGVVFLIFYNFVATSSMLDIPTKGRDLRTGSITKYFFNLLFFQF